MAKKIEGSIEVKQMQAGIITAWIKGVTPLICHRMAGKAMRELLAPKGRKGKAEREQTLKHDPLSEYRGSMSMRPATGQFKVKEPTRLVFPSPAVKGAIATAALETEGTSKAQIGRLVWVEGFQCDLYGVPQLHMCIVRSADMNKTPDVRTRAILSEWCMPVTIKYVKPQINETVLCTLLANGGLIVGIGDFRQEKGKGNYGQFEIAGIGQSCPPSCKAIVAAGGIKQQDAAIKNPECFDAETAELLAWFHAEIENRGKTGMLSQE